MRHLVDKDFKGAVNGSSNGTISLREIINYIEEKSGKKVILKNDGESAPYNSEPEYSINTEKSQSFRLSIFRFERLDIWIDRLLYFILKGRLCIQL